MSIAKIHIVTTANIMFWENKFLRIYLVVRVNFDNAQSKIFIHTQYSTSPGFLSAEQSNIIIVSITEIFRI